MIRRTIAAALLAALAITAAPAVAGADTTNPTLNGQPCRALGCTGPEDGVDCWVGQAPGWQPEASPRFADWRRDKVRQRSWDGRYEVLIRIEPERCPEVLPDVRVALEDVPAVTAYLASLAEPVPVTLDAYDWARLAECESGGEPTTNTGNGFYGMYQFTLRSWQFVGGRGLPSDASAAEQTERARLLLDVQGPGAWPVCSQVIGWR